MLKTIQNFERIRVFFWLVLFALALGVGETLAQNTRGAVRDIERLKLRVTQKRDAVQQVLGVLPQDAVSVAQALFAQATDIAEKALADFETLKTKFSDRNTAIPPEVLVMLAAIKRRLENADRLFDQTASKALEVLAKRFVNRLTSLMRQAESLVIGSKNKEAERLLQEARRYENQFRRAIQAQKLPEAIENYELATEFADRSIKIAQTRSADQERAQFQALADRTKKAIESCDNPRAQNIYDRALRQFQKAEQAFREGDKLLAGQFYNGSIRLLLRAQDLCSNQQLQTRDLLKTELATVKELFRSLRNRSQVMDSERGRQIVGSIENNLVQIERDIQAQRVVAAKGRLKLVRNLIDNASRARGQTSLSAASRIEAEIEQLKSALAAANDRISSDNADAKELLGLAQAALNRAEQAVRQGRARIAVQQVLVGQRFLTKAENKERGGRFTVTETVASNKIARLKQMLDDATAKTAGFESANALQLIRSAETILQQAREKFAGKQFFLAGELADVGMELLRTNESVIQR